MWALPASIYDAWCEHFQSHPPSDPYRVEWLLAQLVMMFANVHAARGVAPITSVTEIAPWLETPELRAAAEKEEEEAHSNVVLDIARRASRA